MDKIESFLTGAAHMLGELFQTPAAGAPPAPAAKPGAAPADSVDHAAADGSESTGVTLDDYQRLDTSGDRRLDDQLLLARTGGPAVGRASGPPQMTATGQYRAGDHNCFVVRFDRPVSREEAEKAIFKAGQAPAPLPAQLTGPGEIHDNRVILQSSASEKGGRSSEWTLALPGDSWTANFKSLNDGVEAKILDAPPGYVPGWIPTASRSILDSREIPRPGDARFTEVRTGYPSPNDQVTTWREGHSTFRYDGRTGRVEGMADRPGADLKGFNDLRNRLVLEEGRSIDDATRETSLRTHRHLAEAIVDFVLDGYLKRDDS